MSPKKYITKVSFELTHPEEDLPKLNDLERLLLEMRLGLGKFTRQHTLQEITNVLSSDHSHTWARDRINRVLKKVRHIKINKDQTND